MVVYRILKLLSPLFVGGYIFGWLETIQYASPRGGDENYFPLSVAVALQAISLLGVVASVFANWEGDEEFFSGAMMFISISTLGLFYVFYSTPYVILALITGLNFPYVFCLLTWGGPLLALAVIRAID